MQNLNTKNVLRQARKVQKTGLFLLNKTSFYIKSLFKKINLANIKLSSNKMKVPFYVSLVLIIFLIGFALKPDSNNKNLNSASLSNITIESGLPEIPEKTEKVQENKLDFSIASEREKDPSFLTSSNGSALVPPKTDFQASAPKTRTEIETYTVQPGDTVSTIASKFGLYWSTILWENDLNAWSVIQPGQELKILPTNGITHKVKNGENISYIANKYNSTIEQISKFNNVGDEISPGQTLIVPDGTPPPKPKPKPRPEPEPNKTFVSDNNGNYSYTDWRYKRFASTCHRFYRYPGQCTDWAAFKWALEENQCVPSDWGHAKSWYYHAKSDGYQVSPTPKPGAIMSLDCNAWACDLWGHVAYVESVNSSYITISELNASGNGQYQSRTLLNKTGVWQDNYGWKILGYIYPLQ